MKMKTSRKWIAPALIAMLVAVPVASKVLRGSDAKDVEIERVEPRALTPSILASGTLVYESQVNLVPEVIGRVDAVLVKEGDQVKKGQVLIRLDAETSRAETVQLEASLRQSQLQIERQKVNRDSMAVRAKRYADLREHGLVEATKYDELVTEVNLAEVELRTSREAAKQAGAALHQSQERLAKTEIRAPIDGKVTAVAIKTGETAVPAAVSIAGSNLMTISDTSSMFAEVNVDETDVARVAVGQEAKIVPAAFPDRSLRGRVVQVAMAPKQNAGQSRTYPVRVRLDVTDLPFHPGMSCRAEIAIAKSGGAKNLGVPVQAVQYEEAEGKADKSKAYVYVYTGDGGKAVRRSVETGVADDAYIEITSGLKASEQVVVGPSKTLRFLRDGEAVRAKDPAPAGKPA